MKILVVFTGGTIGSKTTNGWISTDENTLFTLTESYKKRQDVEFVCHNPYTILSENLSENELNILQKEIADNLNSIYDGIIVTHGTDTLQYTSCAIQYAFSFAKIPIVFVSSSTPLENKNANGYNNFEAAVEFIYQHISEGVFVSYKNDNDALVNFHIPSLICRHGECSSDINSINNKVFASYDGVIKTNGLKYPEDIDTGIVQYVKNPGILVIDSYPGNNYLYSLDNVNAVILNPYHSATLNTASDCFKSFCNLAKKKSIPVFLANAGDGIAYESTKEYNNLGIISLKMTSFISAYVKLWLAVSAGYDIIEFMKK